MYRINDDVALIQTVDIFPPNVDDPYEYGQIAAANSLSDVWAMGGVPKLCMNIFMFPEDLPSEDVHNILLGGYDKVREAGAVVVGGHTIKDNVPKYGLCVSGFVHPEKVLKNNGIRPGDALILTKPVGTGVLTNADKGGLLGPKEHKKLVDCMARLNKYASEAVTESGVTIHACTDVTGFALLGHSYEMSEGSGCSIYIDSSSVPFLPEAKKFAAMGLVPTNAYKNRNHLKGKVNIAPSVSEDISDLLFDPQTSGGLLYAIPADEAAELIKRLNETVPEARIVGYADTKGDSDIYVI